MNLMDSKEYLSDRIEKLTWAIYRVTDLLSDKEPVKWSLREKALVLYNNIISFLNGKEEKVFNSFNEIIDFLELISKDSSIFSTNYEILKTEYQKLEAFVTDKKSELIKDELLLEELSKKETVSNGHIRHIGHIRQTPVYHGSETRKEKIIEILKGGPKTIGEIFPLFQGIGEKSIQRDLFDLVKNNKITAEGEKRWRKYRLLLTDIHN